MDYIKVTFEITPCSQDNADIMTALLAEIGFESFVDTLTGIEAYIQQPLFNNEVLKTLHHPVKNVCYSYTVELIADQNWNEYWEKNYLSPIIISDRCVVRSPFHDEFPDMQYRITIEPKMAFGTGHHETTSMMMEFLLENSIAGKTVLDMGCGTGILAILASMRGASNVTAVDNDHWCTENCVENCRMNAAGNVHTVLGDAAVLCGMPEFDVIAANINRNILINDIPAYKKVLRKGGMLIVSGFYDSDADKIDEVCNENGLFRMEMKERNSWVAIKFSY